jgi:hypothetical protein
VLTIILCAAVAAAGTPWGAEAAGSWRGGDDLPAREEINQTYELAPGARVEVSSISGPVVVETSDTRTAEVHIVRSAETEAELACYRTIVEHSASSLVIRNEQDRTRGCRNIRAHQRVLLRLPRAVSLRANSISGNVTVGGVEGGVRLSSISGNVRIAEVDGTLELNSISGGVEVAQSAGYSNISSVSGSVNLAVARLGERGIDINSISGRVELHLAGDLNADVSVDSISGSVHSDVPNVTVSKVGSSSFRARVGAGGAPISISSVSGSVRLSRE